MVCVLLLIFAYCLIHYLKLNMKTKITLKCIPQSIIKYLALDANIREKRKDRMNSLLEKY